LCPLDEQRSKTESAHRREQGPEQEEKARAWIAREESEPRNSQDGVGNREAQREISERQDWGREREREPG
jgi:hypothetical protein